MKRGPPAREPGRALGRVGRARVFELDGGQELWRLPAEDERPAGRLIELGAVGIGGFVEAGVDADGIWLVRAVPTSLASWLKNEPSERSWATAVRVCESIARAAGECEDENLFPGPLSPRAVSLHGDAERADLRADPLVHAVVGAQPDDGKDSPGGSGSTRWMAPEQAAGAPWDNAANRYVLGLILYRMLSGQHPFAGKGLRHALDDQAERGAPPMSAEVAEALPPGLQSYCLRMLDPDAGARPESAPAVAERLGSFLRERDASAAPGRSSRASRASAPEPASAPADDEPPSRPPRRKTARSKRAEGRAAAPRPKARAAPPARQARSYRSMVVVAAPLAAGLAFAYAATRSVDVSPEPAASVGQRAPLAAISTRSDDCAACHPRQTAEWRRSVMAHSVKSPLFQSLEILIEEQVGRDFDCPGGAGALRAADDRTACRNRQTGLPITGFGGELWCVNCHAPGENLKASLPAWDGRSRVSGSRAPLKDLLPSSTMEGISCAVCHQTHGPARPGNFSSGLYEGNPFWTSIVDGTRFSMRPEDARGWVGISNSGYFLDPSVLLPGLGAARETVLGGVHRRPSEEAKRYLKSSEFCGACHDVRLFGTDVLGVRQGEHFKRLRNAYSEWAAWKEIETRAGRPAATCQDCHMSTFPGVCVPGEAPAAPEVGSHQTALATGCPPGTRFEARPPGSYPRGRVATSSGSLAEMTTHFFSGVDVPLGADFSSALISETTIDAAGLPLGARQRRDLLLGATFRLTIEEPRVIGSRLSIPLVIENTGAGHRVPAGFSQEREFWVHFRVTDARGAVVYEVGRIDRSDQDLRDKVFLRVNTRDDLLDGSGRPLGLFGADVADGPDAPRWNPPPELGGTEFRGRGLINFQNGFLRCVVCIGEIDASGRCQPLPGQGRARGDRFADGDYDIDTGECRSNLRGENALFEIYFPVGSLDSARGVIKGPDAIIDTRSAPPGVPLRYTYDVARRGHPGPYRVEARLMFRAFPPFLIKAFADYEERQARLGRRPSGALITRDALKRLDVVELNVARAVLR